MKSIGSNLTIWKMLISVLCVLMIITGSRGGVNAAEKKERPKAVMISASDFQNPQGHTQGEIELRNITDRMYDQGKIIVDEALICGDYYHDDNDMTVQHSGEGIESVYRVLQNQWGLEYEDIYFVQGNHDPKGTKNLDITGGTDRESYSVYQINHDEFRWCQDKTANVEQVTAETAMNLKTWLSEKNKTGYSKPIFVISHLPLHHSRRYDNQYSEYLFDVLNEEAEKGLNIVYLFGHNHANDYDQYLGGSAIFLTKGDEIFIPDVQGEDVSRYKKEKLNFTYMNAGYVGETFDQMLSVCCFEIYEDRVVISRYTSEGEAYLKNAGTSGAGEFQLPLYEKEVESPYVLALNKAILSLEDEAGEQEGIRLEPKESTAVKIDAKNCENYNVIWEISNNNVADVFADERTVTQGTVLGKAYGTSLVTVKICDKATNRVISTLSFPVTVVPKQAIKIKGSKYLRYYTPVESIQEKLLKDNINKEYMILNSSQRGSAKAFKAQNDEYVSTKEMNIIYVPEIGNVVTPKMSKNVLWRFEEVEGVLDNKTEYRLRVSSKSSARDGYYIAVTSGVDQGLGYPNTTNIRTGSKETSDGVALFWFDETKEPQENLITSHHYKMNFKPNENGKFTFGYSESNGLFGVYNTPGETEVYFYERIDKNISDMFIWTEQKLGSAIVGSDEKTEVGGVLHILYENNEQEIPITLSMLEGYDKETPGQYQCSIVFNGEIITEGYELTLVEEPSGISRIFAQLKDFLDDFMDSLKRKE